MCWGRSNNSDQLFFLVSTSSSMLLLSYFQVAPRRDLLDPAGPLSSELSLSAISEANAAVNGTAQRAKESKKRGAYIKLDEKTKISTRARMGSAWQRGASRWSQGAGCWRN